MTALMTVATSGGGDVKDLISAMNFLSSIVKASWAAIRAGSAFLSSLSASCANAIVSTFSFSIFIFSPSIKTIFSSASFLFLAITRISSSATLVF